MLAEIMMTEVPKRAKNIIGTEFGDGCVVIGYLGQNNSGSLWLAECICGNEFKINRKYIFNDSRNNTCRSCSLRIMGKKLIKNTTGKFGRWTVLKMLDERKDKAVVYLCKCDCGTVKKIKGNMLRDGGSKSCGCVNIERLKRQTGSKHPRWNAKLTKSIRQKQKAKRKGFVGDSDLTKWRKSVFDRDYYTCRCCGTKKSPFNVHHLNGWKPFPDERYDIPNGITLCVNCHKLFHKKYGNGNNTKEQYQEFFLLRYNG